MQPRIGDGDGEFGERDFMFEEELDILGALDNQCTFLPAEGASVVDSIETCGQAGFFFLQTQVRDLTNLEDVRGWRISQGA